MTRRFKILVNKGEGKRLNAIPSLFITKNPFVFYSCVKWFGKVIRVEVSRRNG